MLKKVNVLDMCRLKLVSWWKMSNSPKNNVKNTKNNKSLKSLSGRNDDLLKQEETKKIKANSGETVPQKD